MTRERNVNGSFIKNLFQKKKQVSNNLSYEQIAQTFHDYILFRIKDLANDSDLKIEGYNLSKIASELSFMLVSATDYAIYDLIDSRHISGSIRKELYNIVVKYMDHISSKYGVPNIKELQGQRILSYAEIIRNNNSINFIEEVGKEFSKFSGYEKDVRLSLRGSMEFTHLFEFVARVIKETFIK